MNNPFSNINKDPINLHSVLFTMIYKARSGHSVQCLIFYSASLSWTSVSLGRLFGFQYNYVLKSINISVLVILPTFMNKIRCVSSKTFICKPP